MRIVLFRRKVLNSSNVSQTCPIENLSDDKMYNDGWQAKNENQLVVRIKICLKEFSWV